MFDSAKNHDRRMHRGDGASHLGEGGGMTRSHPRTIHGLLTLTLLLHSASGLAAPRVSRDQPGGLGSAIALEYSVQHDVMRPGEDVTLLLCLANHDTESRRDVQPGDSFAFEFAAGTLGACGSITTISPTSSLEAADFACAVDGQVLTLTHVGAATQWPALDAVCVRVPYSVPAAPTRVATSMSVANIGAFRAPSPSMILLNVGDDLGSVGPQGETGPVGPVGPIGPAGETGATGAGVALMAVSTDIAYGQQGEPPMLVPGLDIEIAVASGSKLEVTLDSIEYECSLGVFAGFYPPTHLVEVDAAIVVERKGPTFGGFGGGTDGNLISASWLSAPLAAGIHRVRVLIDLDDPSGGSSFSRCVGSGSDARRQSRLIVKEIRSTP